ncbi:MAG: hypothetical protein DWQ04_18050 [Chloroflexi bacterium]|nr:MAG: hypothetical protein DWQ04_18050 [Chloroflexota bacterium]
MTTETDSSASPESTQMSRRQGWVLVGALLLLSLVLFFIDFSPSEAEPRQVAEAAGFQPLAILSDVEMSFAPGLGENTAVFIGTLTPGSKHQLNAIDFTTGEQQWAVTGSDRSYPYFWPEEWPWSWPLRWEWGPLIIVDDKVMVADAFLLTTSVNSFDVTTGEPGWQRTIGTINGSSISYLAALDDEIALRISVEGFNEFQILDTDVGFRQYQRMQDANHIFWAEQEPQQVFEAFANQIRVTGDSGWQQSVSGCNVQPILLAELVVVKTNRCGRGEFKGHPGVFALSRANGALLWQLNQEVVSNLAVDGTHVVGLTSEANLLVIDVGSGAVFSSLPFSPLEFGEERDYFIAARDGVISVYFGDSHELIFVRYQ